MIRCIYNPLYFLISTLSLYINVIFTFLVFMYIPARPFLVLCSTVKIFLFYKEKGKLDKKLQTNVNVK